MKEMYLKLLNLLSEKDKIKILRKIVVVFVYLFCYSTGHAQKEKNVWHFGAKAGLNFNSGVPVAIVTGQLATFEGCASIADSSGRLLFYSDGVGVWNRNHFQMSNGANLMGDQDATQSATIIPKPGSTTQYYLFTIDRDAGTKGIRYSVIDMNLNSGLGDVTVEKNISLLNKSTEKIAVIKHCNRRDNWIVTHDWSSDTFRVFLLTASGINVTPILSKIGAVHTGSTWNTNGYMKASPDGSRLALAACHGMNIFELFDFNNSTGIVSNAITLISPSSSMGEYGVEFSPDGKKLYGSTISPGRILQFDLCAGPSSGINQSRTIVGTSRALLGALQLGPDNKIYVARGHKDSLGIINAPDIAGVNCNYKDNALYLNGANSKLGLPTFVAGTQVSYSDTFNYQTNCLQANFDLSLTNCAGVVSRFVSVSWNFGDSLNNSETVSILESPMHTFNAPGDYQVRCELTYECGFSETQTKIVHVEDCEVQFPESIFFPNAFTPDNDQLNDIFIPRGTLDMTNAVMFIFNRWGELIFSTSDFNKGWDGKKEGVNSASPMGVYVWQIRQKNVATDKEIVYTGHVALIR